MRSSALNYKYIKNKKKGRRGMETEREDLKEKIAAMTDEQFQWFIDQALRLLSATA